MKTSLIRFCTSDNLRLDGLLFEPNKKTNKIVIHVHGTSSDFFTNRFIDSFSKDFTKIGFSLLTFNNRGAGRDTRFYKEINGRFIEKVRIGSKKEYFEECLIDIQAALDFAKSKGYDEIVLSGSSYGCNKVIHFAIINKGVCSGIILIAPCDLVGLITDPNTVEWRWHDIQNIDLFRYGNKTINPQTAKIKNDVLAEFASDDEYIAQTNKRDCIDYLQKAFSNARVTGHIIENANHGFCGYEGELARNVAGWLRGRAVK